MGIYPFLTMLLALWIRQSTQNLCQLTDLRWALNAITKPEKHSPKVFPCYPCDKKQTWCYFSSYRMPQTPPSHKVPPNYTIWRLQTVMKNFWRTLLLSNHSLLTSGCPLINSLVCMPYASGWYQRGFSPSWSPPRWWVKPGSTSPLILARKWGSKEIIPMATLVRDGVGEGKVEKVTIFCCSDQVKVEP